MIVILEREDGHAVGGFADPAGGTFDAAGDFDRVLPANDDSYAVLRIVDPGGDMVLGASQMRDLLADIDRLGARTRRPIERRGLDRLRVMAERCREDPTLHLRFVGGPVELVCVDCGRPVNPTEALVVHLATNPMKVCPSCTGALRQTNSVGDIRDSSGA